MASSYPLKPSPFPAVTRIISTHDSNGKAIFSDTAASIPITRVSDKPDDNISPGFALAYWTDTFPVRGPSPTDGNAQVAANSDLHGYIAQLGGPRPPPVEQCSTECLVVEFPPNFSAPMHSNAALDYGVILSGTLEWKLDSTETRLLRNGDVIVQRGTAHAWRNVTPLTENDGWLRAFFVSVPIEKAKLEGGKELGANME